MGSNEKEKHSFSVGIQILFVLLGSIGMFFLSRFGVIRAREYVIVQFAYPLLLVLTGCRLQWKWTLAGGAVFTILSVCIRPTLFPPLAPCTILISRILVLLKGLVTVLIVKLLLQKRRDSLWMSILSVVLGSIAATLLYYAAVRFDLLDRMRFLSDRDVLLAETLQYAISGFVISGFVFMLGGFAAIGISRLMDRRNQI